MESQIEGTIGLDRHQFETRQREISLLIASSKENTSQRGGQTIYKSMVARCLFDCGRRLISIKFCLSPQYGQQLFVWQHFLDQSTSALKPSPKRR